MEELGLARDRVFELFWSVPPKNCTEWSVGAVQTHDGIVWQPGQISSPRASRRLAPTSLMSDGKSAKPGISYSLVSGIALGVALVVWGQLAQPVPLERRGRPAHGSKLDRPGPTGAPVQRDLLASGGATWYTGADWATERPDWAPEQGTTGPTGSTGDVRTGATGRLVLVPPELQANWSNWSHWSYRGHRSHWDWFHRGAGQPGQPAQAEPRGNRTTGAGPQAPHNYPNPKCQVPLPPSTSPAEQCLCPLRGVDHRSGSGD